MNAARAELEEWRWWTHTTEEIYAKMDDLLVRNRLTYITSLEMAELPKPALAWFLARLWNRQPL